MKKSKIEENVKNWMSIKQSEEDLIGMFFGKCMDMGSEKGGLMSVDGLKQFTQYILVWKQALLNSEVERTVKEITGEDEILSMDEQCPYCRAMRFDCECEYFSIRNQLRAEQRAKWKALSELQVEK